MIRKTALNNIKVAQERQKRQYDAKHCKDKAKYQVGPRTTKTSSTRTEIVPVFCICRLPDNGETIVQCSSCEEWFHRSCIRMPNKQSSFVVLHLLLTLIIRTLHAIHKQSNYVVLHLYIGTLHNSYYIMTLIRTLHDPGSKRVSFILLA